MRPRDRSPPLGLRLRLRLVLGLANHPNPNPNPNPNPRLAIGRLCRAPIGWPLAARASREGGTGERGRRKRLPGHHGEYGHWRGGGVAAGEETAGHLVEIGAVDGQRRADGALREVGEPAGQADGAGEERRAG